MKVKNNNNNHRHHKKQNTNVNGIKQKNKNRKLLYLILIILLVCVVIFTTKIYNQFIEVNNEIDENDSVVSVSDNIEKYYSKYVKTNTDILIYNDVFEVVGKIAKDVELTLEDFDSEDKLKFFTTIINGTRYYIDYNNLDKIEKTSYISDRYKNYVLFNSNIVTSEKTLFYDELNNLVYEFNNSYSLPIIIKDSDKYGVEFNDKLLYIKEENVKEIINNKNTEKTNSKGIPVLNYHFVYEDDDYSCNEIICHSASQINQHFSYINDNGYFTPTMEELEMYIDGIIQLPQKSVSITFDDGARAEVAKKYVDMYEVNATLFLITGWYPKEKFESQYFEIHSHGHELHTVGVCPGGQGGAIKCLEKEKLVADLKASSERLDGSTVFCYPFYEYNSYSIEVLKETGYTMAFAGFYADGNLKVKVGANKYELPRIVMYSYTNLNQFINYLQ